MTIVPPNDDSFLLIKERPAPTAEVVFVGNQFSFSGSLIAATSQDLGNISSTVVQSFSHFRMMIDAARIMPVIAVLDEPSMRGLSSSDRDYLLDMSEVAIGLAYCSEAYGVACYHDERLRLRAASIFPLDVRLDIWLSIIKLIAHGGNYVCPELISAQMAGSVADASDDCALTQRQLDVLRLVADGQSNKRIAGMLGLSIHTVKLHLHNASLRLGARNRTEAAMRFRAMRP